MAETNTPLHFLATRLCHDVAGPISAINQGLELLEDADESMREEAMKLIVQSAQQASVRLQFYRMVYGHTPEQGEGTLEPKRAIIEGFLAPLRISLQFEDSSLLARAYSHTMQRLIINALMIAAETMLRGGEIRLSDASDAENEGVQLQIRAVQLKLDLTLLERISEEKTVTCADAKDAQHYSMQGLLHAAGGQMQAQKIDESCWQLTLHMPHVKVA